VDDGDLVLAAARSYGERPILYGDWLKESSTVVSIGSTIPQQRELDVSVVQRSDLIVCDALEEVLEETGDMIAARAAGISLREKSVTLAELMSGVCKSRLEASKVSLFKSVGGGLQDVVVAELILTKALAAGLATPLPIQFETKI
jgi:ornithine cyclodeaminase/alanine dehydrogenase-like protein (mu-crystallin family)